MEKPKGISMPLPAGFTPPEGVKEGDSFDAVASLTLSGGSLMLTELDGIPVGGGKAEPEESEMESEEMPEMEPEDFENAIERGMR